MDSMEAKQYLDAFCEAMRKKVCEMELKNTEFTSPCGAGEAAAADIVRCLINANRYEVLRNIWGENIHTVMIDGEDPRELVVKSTIFEECDSHILTDKYHVWGGKTGTLTRPGAFNISFIADIPDSDDKAACTIMYAYEKNGLENNRFKAALQVMDAITKKYHNPDVDISNTEVCASNVCAYILPKNDEEPTVIFEKVSNEMKMPASMIKMTTAMVVLDTIADLDEKVLVCQEVIELLKESFRGDDFKAGDVVSVRDLLSAMMLPSSNNASYILAVHTGAKLVK